jgi:hypothetical protein
LWHVFPIEMQELQELQELGQAPSDQKRILQAPQSSVSPHRRGRSS